MRELDPKSPHELPACAVVGAGRLGTVLAAALSDAPAAAARGAGPGGRRGRAAVRARRQDRRGRGGRPGRAAARPLLRRDRPRGLRRPRGLLAAPADVGADRAATPSVLRGAGAAVDGTSRARARRSRTRSASALGHARDPRRARGPRRLPRRGRDRGQLPRRARGLRRAARGHRPGSPARSSPRSCSPPPSSGRELGPGGGADRPDRPRRRGHRRAPSRRRSPSARPELLPVWTELAEVTRAVAGRTELDMRTIRTIARDAGLARQRARRGPDGRPRADDGRLPRRPPLADARGARGAGLGRRLAVRQPGAVQRRRATSPPTRAPRPTTPPRPPSSASTCCSPRR